MEPKIATIVSVEIPGFSGLASQFSSKEFKEILKEFYEIVNTTVRLHQGVISNYSGSTFMAVFVSEKLNSKLPLLAIEAVVELKERIRSFTLDKNLPLIVGFKVGIASGDAIVEEFGTTDKKHMTVMGDAVDSATRLREFAEKGKVLINKDVFEATKDHYHFQKLESLPTRGSKGSLKMFELGKKKRIKLQASSLLERKIASEMVGRTREMEMLEALIKDLISGKGNIVSIVGKAGIGKSRLVEEIKAQPLLEGIVLLQGSAFSIGKNLSYHPIISIFKSSSNITEKDSPQLSSKKLQKEIKRVAPKEMDEIYPFIATMMGFPLSDQYKERLAGIEGEALEKLILKNARDLIMISTKVRPLIVLIEDLHWADNSSITFLESLFKLSVNYRVLFINVLRPGYKEAGDYILKYLVDNLPGNNITINIAPLVNTESATLIGNLLQQTQLPDEINQVIIKKTEGNPFFIEEVIRSFIDEGIIEIRGNKFWVSDKIHTAKIPETINDVILSRVDKLDKKTKELLKTASVIGRNFYYKLLEEATDTISELDERLEYLKDVQLISESKPKAEIEFLFKHALAQQLTYDSIIQQSRKDLHQKIAKSIEKVFAENIQDFYGTLAYHYIKAENEEKTIHYLILAGDESMKSGAFSEALNFYKNVLELLPQKRKQDLNDKEILNLNINIAATYHTLGRNDLAIKKYEMIIRNYFNFKFAKSERGIMIRGIFSLVQFFFIINFQFLFFKRKMNPDLEILMKLFNNWGYAYIHYNSKHFAFKGLKVLVYTSLYNFRHSISALSYFIDNAILFNFTGISISTAKKMIDLAQKNGVEDSPQTFVNYRMTLKIQNYFTGKWEADEDYIQTYNTGLQIGKYWTAITYIYYSGMCAIESGNYKGFQNIVKNLDEIAELQDISYAKILKYRLLTMGYLKFRELDKLSKIADEGIAYIKKTGDGTNFFMVYCLKAQGCLYLGETAEAKYALENVVGNVDKHKMVPIFYSQYLLSNLEYKLKKATELSNGDKLFKSVNQELNQISNKLIKQSKKNIASLSTAFLMKARVLLLQRKKSKAFKYLKKSIIAAEKYDTRLELSRTYFETGKFLSDPNTEQSQLNGFSGKEYLEKAKILFEEMDLQWDLEEYDKYINGKE